MKSSKRILSSLLAFSMVLSSVSLTPLTAYAVDEEIAEEVRDPASVLSLDAEKTVTQDDYDEYYYFTPESDGYYTFCTKGDYDTVGRLYDSDGDEIARDDDSGEDYNFNLIASLMGGEEYSLRILDSYLGDEYSFSIHVTKAPDPIGVTVVNGGYEEVDEISLYLDEGVYLYSTVDPEDASQICFWSTDNPSVLSVDYSDSDYAYIEALSEGTATVTAATANGKKDTVTVTVSKRPEATSVSIKDSDYNGKDVESLTLYSGQYEYLEAVLTPEEAETGYSWSSSNEEVVYADSGRIEAVGLGTATVTVTTENGFSDSCVVTVIERPAISDIYIKDSNGFHCEKISLYTGSSKWMNVVTKPDEALCEYEWSSSNENVAVERYGSIVAVAPGTATLTVTAASGVTDTIVVTVSDYPEISGVKIKDNSGYDCTSFELYIDENKYLNASLEPKNARGSYTWTSSDESVATIEYGTVTGISEGTATITLTSENGFTDTCTVTVKKRPVISEIRIVDVNGFNCENATIFVDGYAFLNIDTAPDGVGYSHAWSSSDETVATVSDGVVLGVGVGTTTITLTDENGLKDTCTITVLETPVITGISIIDDYDRDVDTATLYVDERLQLFGDFAPSYAIGLLNWSSDNESVAIVSEFGYVTAVATGTAKITVTTAGGLTDTCTINVIKRPDATEAVITDRFGFEFDELTIIEGERYECIYAVITPYDADDNYSWSSADETVAKVTSTGIVTGVKEGTTTIILTTESGLTDTCPVTVKKAPAATKVVIQDDDDYEINELSLYVGNEYSNLSAEIIPGESNDSIKSWTSSDESVVCIYGGGYIEAVGVGTAIITVTTESGLTDTCKVIVSEFPEATSVELADNSNVPVEELTVYLGKYTDLKAIIDPYVANTVDWYVDDSSVARLNSQWTWSDNNLGGACLSFEAVGLGTATITVVTENGLKDTCKINVVDYPETEKIIITNRNSECTELTLYTGESTYLYTEITPVDALSGCTWASSNRAVATISSGGRVNAISPGTATITVVSKGGAIATCKVTVINRPEISEITIVDEYYSDLETATLYVGEFLCPDLIIDPDNCDFDHFWETSDISVAFVEGDRIEAVGPGKVVITVKTEYGVSDSLELTVLEKNEATEIEVFADKDSILPREKLELYVSFLPYASAEELVAWSTSDESVAVVSKDGVVTGVSAGTATITATTASGLTATYKVTVKGAKVLTTEKPVSVDVKADEKEYLTFTPDESGVYCIFVTEPAATLTDTYIEIFDVVGDGFDMRYDSIDLECEAGVTYNISVFTDINTTLDVAAVKYVDAEEIIVTPDSVIASVGSDYWDMDTYFTPEIAANERFTWTTADPDIVQIKWGGFFFVGEGTTTVTATSVSGLTDTITVTVKPAVEIKEGETKNGSIKDNEYSSSFVFVPEEDGVYKISLDADFSHDIAFRNSCFDDISVEYLDSVDSYQVELSKNEICYIAIREYYGEYGDFTLSVEKLVPAESIFIDIGTEVSGYRNSELYPEVIFAPENAAIEDISWFTSDPEIVEINDYGDVRLIAPGVATITAKTESGLTATCKITVKDFPTILLNETKTVSDKMVGNDSYYYFTPEKDGYYVFYSYNTTIDTYGYIYNSNFRSISSDDDSGVGYNFKAGANLKGGVTYILGVRDYKSATYNVRVVEGKEITGLELVSMPVMSEYVVGYVEDYVDYYGLVLKVTWADGTVTNWKYDGEWQLDTYRFKVDTSELTTTGKVVVRYGECSVDLQFTIVENTVDHIELVSGTETTYIENYNGHFEGNTFYYNVSQPDDAVVKIVYKDGTSEIANVSSLINGYIVSWKANQSEEPWFVGTDNKSTITYLGKSVNLPITVVKNAVEKIEVVSGDKITYFENNDGDYDSVYNDETGEYEEYFNYFLRIPENVTFRITYTDGSTKEATICEEVDGVDFEYYSDQDVKHWVLGDDNIVYISYLGAVTTLPVSIVNNPVDRIEITNAPTKEYIFGDAICGYMNGDNYVLSEISLYGLAFTVYYDDGTSKKFTYDDFENDRIDGFDARAQDSISVKTAGKYNVTFTYGDASDDFEITIKKSEVASIEVTKSVSPKRSFYYLPDFVGTEFTITDTDGTTKVVTLTEDNIEFVNRHGGVFVEIDEHGIYILEAYIDGESLFAANYLGAECYVSDFEDEELPDISEIALDNVTENGDGMIVDIAYADGTTEKIVIDMVYSVSNKTGTGNLARTAHGILPYEITKSYDDNGRMNGYIVNILGEDIFVEAADVLYGDVNGDGKVNNIDVLNLRKHIAGGWNVTIDLVAADVNCDGRVNNIDVLNLRKFIAGGWDVVLGPKE